jgi:branched-chain amino acid aminotransferase
VYAFYSEELFVEAIRQLVSLDDEWVTSREGHSLYIRPFMYATDELVGIRPSRTYKFLIITTPVGQYYSEPVNVKIEKSYTRAASGGVGRAKAAGNYAHQCTLLYKHRKKVIINWFGRMLRSISILKNLEL